MEEIRASTAGGHHKLLNVTGSKVLDIILKGCFIKAVDLDVESFILIYVNQSRAGRKGSSRTTSRYQDRPSFIAKATAAAYPVHNLNLQLPVIIRDIVRALFPVQLKLSAAWLLCVKAKAQAFTRRWN